MRVLFCALLLSVAAEANLPYSSAPQWENLGEDGDQSEQLLGRYDREVPTEAPGIVSGSGGGGGSASGMPFINLDLPVCMDDELLEFNGSSLVCKQIPERKCICPEPTSGSGDMTLLPEPPGGCPVFQPPVGGAFVCVRMADMVIYCSVLCDNNREFSSFPVNPYFCGVPSNFKWRDFTNVTHDELPKCNGFRYTLRTLHREQFYLPNKCGNLTAAQTNTVKKDFCCLLMGIPSRRVCADITCDTDDIFIQCP